jgi:hypothetical protein
MSDKCVRKRINRVTSPIRLYTMNIREQETKKERNKYENNERQYVYVLLLLLLLLVRCAQQQIKWKR